MSAAAQSIRLASAGLVILVASGCASLPPGSDYPKVASSADAPGTNETRPAIRGCGAPARRKFCVLPAFGRCRRVPGAGANDQCGRADHRSFTRRRRQGDRISQDSKLPPKGGFWPGAALREGAIRVLLHPWPLAPTATDRSPVDAQLCIGRGVARGSHTPQSDRNDLPVPFHPTGRATRSSQCEHLDPTVPIFVPSGAPSKINNLERFNFDGPLGLLPFCYHLQVEVIRPNRKGAQGGCQETREDLGNRLSRKWKEDRQGSWAMRTGRSSR